MDNQSEYGLTDALSYLEACNTEEANKILTTTCVNDLSNPKIAFTMECACYWKDILSRISTDSPYENGDYLLQEWKTFIAVKKSQTYVYEAALYACCRGVFSTALRYFHRLLNEKDLVYRAEILKKVGLCYKKLGEYDNAKRCLSEANTCHKSQAGVLAELADCYALCGDDRAAKLLFREAFFIDYKKIDIEFFDSNLINILVQKTRELGYTGEMLNAWIPVYGVLWGVFNIKRSLRAQEIGKLKQDIYALETDNKDPARTTPQLVPRLINMYFWLIDYCQTNNDSRLINEILLKIKILDTNIYNLYVK